MWRRRRDAELEAALRQLGPALDRVEVPPPPPALVDRALLAARAELARPPMAPVRPGLAPGFGRELARLLALTAAPLALLVLVNAAIVWNAPGWLADWLPAPLLALGAAAWAFGALGWLALVWGSLPFVAHRRALTRLRETAT
jgi:hypothetical protein